MRIFKIAAVKLAPSEGEVPPRQVTFLVETEPTWATLRVWKHEPSLFFGAMPLNFGSTGWPLGMQLLVIQELLVNTLGATITLLVSIIITAFFIPNMLRKGTLDLLLVKPVWRGTLLLYKYLGGLFFILLNTALAIGGVWLAIGLRSGVWCNSFLLTIPVLTFAFAILYAVSTLSAVLTRSAIVSILAASLMWGLLYALGLTQQVLEQFRIMEQLNKAPAEERISESWAANAVLTVQRVLPRYRDLVVLTTRLTQYDLVPETQVLEREFDVKPVDWQESLAVSGGFIAVVLGLACLRFATKDY
jgi:ABC-type transport system involved in multi-copper enzyme maturation permease subunit